LFGNGLDDSGILCQQIVSAHTGLAGHTAGNDHNIAASGVGPVIRTDHFAGEQTDSRGLGHIKSLALRQTFNYIQQNNISKIIQRRQMCRSRTDIAGPDYCYFFPCQNNTPAKSSIIVV
jgi:hypothetical protein